MDAMKTFSCHLFPTTTKIIEEPGSIANQLCHVLQDIVRISWHEWQSLKSSICRRQGVGLELSLGNFRKSQGIEPLEKLRFGDTLI